MMQIMEFDFNQRLERAVEAAAVAEAPARPGVFHWIDADAEQPAECRELLARLGVPEVALDQLFAPGHDGRHDVYENCLHFSFSEARFTNGRLAVTAVDVILAGRFMFTYHHGETELIRHIRRTCREDFRQFAKSPGFLLYELGDHLIDSYRKTLHAISAAVEQTQLQLFGEVDDRIFLQVAGLTSDLLAFHKVALAARELLHELASRRSPFVSETTQPFLANMAGTLDRVSGDVVTEREVLTETLNLYMGMVSHRTNKVVNRLTVLSMIFLPLSFLCGVYGMNFEHMPELGLRYGYFAFWGLVLTIGGSLLLIMRQRHWL